MMNLEEYTLSTREYIMAADLNASNKLFGGRLLSWIDTGAAIVSRKVMGTRNIVTKKFSEMVFNAPGQLGDIVEIWCKVAKEGNTSLTLECVAVVDRIEGETTIIGQCEVVMVALNTDGRPTPWQKSST